MRFNRILSRTLLVGVLALSLTSMNPLAAFGATVAPPAPQHTNAYVHNEIYRSLSSVYQRRHKNVGNIQVVRWYDNDQAIFTFTLDQKPCYGLASIQETDNDQKPVHVEVTGPLVRDQKLTRIIWWNEQRQTRILGVVNDPSIVKIRTKLEWLTLCEQRVDSRFYLIEIPYGLKDLTDYQYLYVQGIDHKGRVIADTKLTNLKFDNMFLRSKAILHVLMAKTRHWG